MKRFLFLAAVALSLAVVPAALADNGGNGPKQLAQRIHHVGQRFAKRCGTSAQGAPQQCVAFAQKAVTRLQQIDQKLQAKIAAHADDKRVERLKQLDARVQKIEQRVQAWLDGTAPASADPASSLDAALGALAQSSGN